MKNIDPLELFLWTFRRNEKDVVNLYNSLSDLMRIATGGDMLNFGYWDEQNNSPILAQKNLCDIFGKISDLRPGQKILDIGSGISSPAFQWQEEFGPLEITEVNINSEQLKNPKKSVRSSNEILQFINATATNLPFADESFDRILALESAQHFKPLKIFLADSHKILAKNGILALAIPVLAEKTQAPIVKLGMLSMTWSSEHYSIDFVKSLLRQEGFQIKEFKKIGSEVYAPLADYYFANRAEIKSRILKQYPSYVETILFKSLRKMKQVSKNKIIEYLLITCSK